jgi:hypothetical protein
LAAFIAMDAGHRAQAQTVALAVGNALTYNGLTYTISSCGYVLAGAGQSGCGPAGAELEGVGSGPGASIEVIDSTPSTALLSLAGASGNTLTYSDISLSLTVTSTAPLTTISKLTDTLAGTGNTAGGLGVSSAVTSSSTTPNINLTTNLSNLTDTATFASFNTTTAAPPLYLSVDLKVSTLQTGNQGLVTLTSATFQAPEPASIALFATAVTGLAAVRRRSRRPAQQTPTTL